MNGIMVFYIAIMIFLIVLKFILNKDKSGILEKRKKQANNLERSRIIKEKIDEIIIKKTKPTKKRKFENISEQAGLTIGYAEYLLLKIGLGIILTIIFAIIFNSFIMGLFFFLLGYAMPYQIINYIKNKRLLFIEKQIGSFMQMIIKRYENTRDFYKALIMTHHEFKGIEPMYSELKKTILDIELGIPVVDALDALAKRTGNKYMNRLAAYYKVASEIGTDELRRDLMNQAYIQFEEDRQMKRMLKKEIAGPVQEAYVMVLSIPAFALFQTTTNPDYIKFMTKTFMGQVGTITILGVLIGIVWFINAKLGAPIS